MEQRLAIIESKLDLILDAMSLPSPRFRKRQTEDHPILDDEEVAEVKRKRLVKVSDVEDEQLDDVSVDDISTDDDLFESDDEFDNVSFDLDNHDQRRRDNIATFFGCRYSEKPVYTFPQITDGLVMVRKAIAEYQTYDKLKAAGGTHTEYQLQRRIRCMQAYINAACYYYYCSKAGRAMISESASARNPGTSLLKVYKKLMNNKDFLHFTDICPRKILVCPDF